MSAAVTDTPASPAAAPRPADGDSDRPLVLLRTTPSPVDRLFSPAALAELSARFRVVELGPDDEGLLDDLLPNTFAIIGQPDLPAERLARALDLRALLNIEGNFYPNVDYPSCFARGVRVLGCGPAYAQAVAEYALGLAIDLARGISREDRAFRAGRERYLGDGNADAILLRHSEIGFIGYGNLGRALRPLLAPFAPRIRVYDPWLPSAALHEADLLPASLEETLTASRILFILAAVTSENQHLLEAQQLALLPAGARVILVSRAAVVDFEALYDRVEQGELLAAIDVWPSEPTPPDDRSRGLQGLVLSAHRAGGIPAAFRQIGDMVLDDLTLIKAGLPPVRMQAAAPELVGRYRNRPAGSPTDPTVEGIQQQ